MSTDSGYSEEDIRDIGEKEFRKEFPSGWMELSRYETLVLIIDTLLESSPSREFTHGELARQSGSSEKSVENHIDSLVRLGVVNKLEDREPTRYTLNDKSPITQKLYELNLTVQKVKDEEIPKSITVNQKGAIKESSEFWNTYVEKGVEDQGNLKSSQAVWEEKPQKRTNKGQIIPGKAAFGAD